MPRKAGAGGGGGRWVGQLPYKKDGPSSEILKRTPRGTEVLFSGHGLNFLHP